MRFSTALAALAAALPLARAALYLVEDSFVGTDFLRNFNWEAIEDPTHGRVCVRLLPACAVPVLTTVCPPGTTRTCGPRSR
jgi:hypothetical protein